MKNMRGKNKHTQTRCSYGHWMYEKHKREIQIENNENFTRKIGVWVNQRIGIWVIGNFIKNKI